jgi:hypothetical protein
MNTPDLFPVPAVLSPRLKWLAEHNLTTSYDAGLASEGEEFPWTCYHRTFGGVLAIGRTEDEAMEAYCLAYGLKHWTLEP